MSIPEKEHIIGFISESPSPLTKRELVRAFGIVGDDRIEFKNLLREMERDGQLVKLPGKEYALPQGLPSVMVIEVTEVSSDGDLFAKPTNSKEGETGSLPGITIMPDKKNYNSLSVGNRVLARLSRTGKNSYQAFIIRCLDTPQGRVMGLVSMKKQGKAILKPANRKAKHDFEIALEDLGDAVDGDMAIGEIQPSRGTRNRNVRIIEVIGHSSSPKAISLISLHEVGIKPDFPEKVMSETKNMKVPPLGKREDLTGFSLVTIDGADAKDFDDAVFAEKTEGGFHIIVAIADVSYYVRPETPLDREAYRRGNSTYFPDRVVPMLPEALSNDLCSLRPKENRACLAVHMQIDEQGRLLSHRFVRGIMRSQARLTYDQVQAVRDGYGEDDDILPVITPLYEAFHILDEARKKRHALELEIPERRIEVDEDGNMIGVSKKIRFDSHRLIEEFMVLANVAAAQELEKRNSPCVYRVHDSPSMEKVDSVREFVKSFGANIPKGQVVRTEQLNHILEGVKDHPYKHLVNEAVLRAQSQAHYSSENIGHYGLALRHYAHFTSPIRRYSDLLVHRSLVRALGLGEGGLDKGEEARIEEICQHISATERTSMEAERSAVDRFTSSFLSERIGAEFAGRIRGVTRFGLFVELDETGADGFIPIRTLPDDFYVHDEQKNALIGRSSGRVYRSGAELRVRLIEADGLTGSTILAVVGTKGADIPGMELEVKRMSGRKGNRGHNRRGKRKRKH